MPVITGQQIKVSDMIALATVANKKTSIPSINDGPGGGRGLPYTFLPGVFFVDDEASMLKLGQADVGYAPYGIAVRTDTRKAYQLQGPPYTQLANWVALPWTVVLSSAPWQASWNEIVAISDAKTVWRRDDLINFGFPLYGNLNGLDNGWTASLSALWLDILAALEAQGMDSRDADLIPGRDRLPHIDGIALPGDTQPPKYSHGICILRDVENGLGPRRNFAREVTFIADTDSAVVDTIFSFSWGETRLSFSNLVFSLSVSDAAGAALGDNNVQVDVLCADGPQPQILINGVVVSAPWTGGFIGFGAARWGFSAPLSIPFGNGGLDFSFTGINATPGNFITFAISGSGKINNPHSNAKFPAISTKPAYAYAIAGAAKADKQAMKVFATPDGQPPLEIGRLFAACSNADGYYLAVLPDALRTIHGDPVVSRNDPITGKTVTLPIFARGGEIPSLRLASGTGQPLPVNPSPINPAVTGLYPRVPFRWRTDPNAGPPRDLAAENPFLADLIRTAVKGLLIKRIWAHRLPADPTGPQLATGSRQALRITFGSYDSFGDFQQFKDESGQLITLTIPAGEISASVSVEWMIFSPQELIYDCSERIDLQAACASLEGGNTGLITFPLQAMTYNAIEAALGLIS